MTRSRLRFPTALSSRFVLVLTLAPWTLACAARGADSAPATAPSDGATADGATPDVAATEVTFATQVERGQALYGQHCAECHGADGTGASAGAVVGPGALKKFANAAEVFAFASEKMPGNAPGSLSDEDMLSILAFDLHANGIDLEEPLGPANAGGIELGGS